MIAVGLRDRKTVSPIFLFSVVGIARSQNNTPRVSDYSRNQPAITHAFIAA